MGKKCTFLIRSLWAHKKHSIIYRHHHYYYFRIIGRTFFIASLPLNFLVFILVLGFFSPAMSYFFGLFNPIPFKVAGVVRSPRVSSSYPLPCLEDQGEFRVGPKLRSQERYRCLRPVALCLQEKCFLLLVTLLGVILLSLFSTLQRSVHGPSQWPSLACL